MFRRKRFLDSASSQATSRREMFTPEKSLDFFFARPSLISNDRVSLERGREKVEKE